MTFLIIALGFLVIYLITRIMYLDSIALSFIGAAQFFLVYSAIGFGLDSFGYYILISITLILAYIDIKEQIVPNKSIIILLILGVITYFFKEITLIDKIIGAFIVSVPMLIIALITGGFGGGDIKLFFAAGFVVGATRIVDTIFFAILAAGLVAFILLFFYKKDKSTQMAFVPFIHFGLIVALLWQFAIFA